MISNNKTLFKNGSLPECIDVVAPPEEIDVFNVQCFKFYLQSFRFSLLRIRYCWFDRERERERERDAT